VHETNSPENLQFLRFQREKYVVCVQNSLSELYSVTFSDRCTHCRIRPSLGPPEMLIGGPLMMIYKKSHATSRGRMAFKTKYPDCRHNFGRTRPV